MRKTNALKADRSRVADNILAEIRDQIVRGIIPKGTKLATERELAERFGVSGPTIREAIRGLTATGLIVVRHGSGAYVTTNTASLLTMSLKNVIQIENMGAEDLLNLMGGLVIQSARLAASAATNTDKARLFEALEQMDTLETAASGAAALRAFNEALAVASHNSLLAILYDYFTGLLVNLSTNLTGDDLEDWHKVFRPLKPSRQELVQAIARGDIRGAAEAAEAFHDTAFEIITASPGAQKFQLDDPHFEAILGQMTSRITTTNDHGIHARLEAGDTAAKQRGG
jgi:GntR family transcriptional regulator, transcriptional repressor for pyruvate dehydrogenase complex